MKIKLLFYYWVSSFGLASLGYLILKPIMPHQFVFGALYRMFTYHWQHPFLYIAIPCLVFGIVTTVFHKLVNRSGWILQVVLTGVIIVLTILISCPLGGILWFYHDMEAGYYPANWMSRMFGKGITWGLGWGPWIIALSIPYNILGSIICYFILRKGSSIAWKTDG